jgi:hypothetical protein
MCALHCSEGKRGVSIVGSLPFETVYLTHSHRLHLRQRHWTKLNCVTEDFWLFGVKVEYVTPLAQLRDLPHLNSRHLILLHHHCLYQETIQLFRWTVGFFAFCLAGSFYMYKTTHTLMHNQICTGSKTVYPFNSDSTTQPEV